jgi:hypothetical protein
MQPGQRFACANTAAVWRFLRTSSANSDTHWEAEREGLVSKHLWQGLNYAAIRRDRVDGISE